MRERVEVEVGVELAVEHAQHVAVELGGDARGVVVRGDEAVDVLHEVGAEQERVARRETARDRRRGTSRVRLGREVADGAAEERDDAASAGGDLVEVVLEVADDRVHLDAVVLAGDRRARRSRSVSSLTSKGTKRGACPRRANASSSRRVFSDVPEPSSTSVSAPVRSAIVAGVLGEDRSARHGWGSTRAGA